MLVLASEFFFLNNTKTSRFFEAPDTAEGSFAIEVSIPKSIFSLFFGALRSVGPRGNCLIRLSVNSALGLTHYVSDFACLSFKIWIKKT